MCTFQLMNTKLWGNSINQLQNMNKHITKFKKTDDIIPTGITFNCNLVPKTIFALPDQNYK